MSLQVHNLIVHRVDKERHGDPELDRRDDVLPLDDEALQFVETLHQHYVRDAKKTYGVFDSDQRGSTFEGYMRKHLNKGIDFVSFSHNAMSKFIDNISGVQMATGGYIVFAHYTSDSSYLSCLMLRNTASFAFTEKMNLRLTNRLDMEHLRHGSCIDLDRWSDKQDAHLSFISAKDEASNYFQRWIGCTTTTSNTEANQNLRRAVLDYVAKLEVEEDEKVRRKEMLFDFAKSCKKNKEPVRLDQAAQFLNPEDPGDFTSFAGSSEYTVDAEIAPNPRILKPIAYLSYNGPGYRLEIKQELIQSRIFEWRDQENQLVLHNVPERLADKLRKIGA